MPRAGDWKAQAVTVAEVSIQEAFITSWTLPAAPVDLPYSVVKTNATFVAAGSRAEGDEEERVVEWRVMAASARECAGCRGPREGCR